MQIIAEKSGDHGVQDRCLAKPLILSSRCLPIFCQASNSGPICQRLGPRRADYHTFAATNKTRKRSRWNQQNQQRRSKRSHGRAFGTWKASFSPDRSIAEMKPRRLLPGEKPPTDKSCCQAGQQFANHGIIVTKFGDKLTARYETR